MKKCNCAYCQEGESKTAEECVDRTVEVTKRLRSWHKHLTRDDRREEDSDEIRLREKEEE